jgi:hypothetical protein
MRFFLSLFFMAIVISNSAFSTPKTFFELGFQAPRRTHTILKDRTGHFEITATAKVDGVEKESTWTIPLKDLFPSDSVLHSWESHNTGWGWFEVDVQDAKMRLSLVDTADSPLILASPLECERKDWMHWIIRLTPESTESSRLAVSGHIPASHCLHSCSPYSAVMFHGYPGLFSALQGTSSFLKMTLTTEGLEPRSWNLPLSKIFTDDEMVASSILQVMDCDSDEIPLNPFEGIEYGTPYSLNMTLEKAESDAFLEPLSSSIAFSTTHALLRLTELPPTQNIITFKQTGSQLSLVFEELPMPPFPRPETPPVGE